MVEIEWANADKQRTYGHDVAASGQVAFLVVAAEVFGRFNDNSRDLVSELVRAHYAGTTRLELGWQRRWWSLLSVAVQVSIAASIVPTAQQFEEGPDSLPARRRAGHDHMSLLVAEQEPPGEVSRLPLRG